MPDIDEVSNIIGQLQYGMDTIVKELHTMNTNISSTLQQIAVVDKKSDKANERIDDLFGEYGPLNNIKKTAEEALKYAEDYNDNKKKVIFGAGLLISLGAVLKWLFTWGP